MTTELYSFVNLYKDDTEFYTHVSQMSPMLGKFRIERKESEKFWKLYCDLLWEKKIDFLSGMSERPRQYIPILADIDIAIEYNEDEPLKEKYYSDKQVKTVIDIYFDVLKYVLPDYDKNDMVCFLLEKPRAYISGYRIKNGFHLHFPFIYMSNIDQEMHIIPRVKRRVEEEKIFENLGISHSGEVIDKATKKHWLMYGSRKDLKQSFYRVTKVYNYKADEITLEEAMKNQNIYNDYCESIEFEKPLEYYLPRILSIEPLNRKNYEAKNTIEVIPKKEFLKAEQVKRDYENMTVPQAMSLVKKLMPLLNPRRANNFNDWIEIGWILYNIGEGCQEALEMWIEFSRLTTEGNFSETGCVFRWSKMTKENYSIGSLRYYAKLDNPQKYDEIQSEEQRQLIMNSLKGGHADIAKQLYDKYSGQFVCANLKEDIWYEYRGHRWYKVEKGITLRSKIATEIIPKYSDEMKRLFSNFSENYLDSDTLSNDESMAEAKKQQSMHKIIACLKQAPFKDNIMRECKELFYKEGFLEKLNTNPYLIGFNNGVLDLRIREFREGKPDDYITMTVGYDWRDFSDEDPEVIEVKDCLFKIFPNILLRQYFMEYAAKLLKAGNFSKTFVVFSGIGDNGKSVIIDLLERVLGDYMVTLSPALVTGKETASSAASPDLELTKNTRFVVLPEPSGKDTISTGILKRLTGNDKVYTRGLFKEGKPMVATFKLCLMCNKLPRLEAEDQAVWNRVRVLVFESLFPKNNELVPKTFEEQIEKKIFHRDSNFNEKLPFMKQAMSWLMFQTYIHIQKYGEMKEPDLITEATKIYRQNNDIYLQYVNERIKEDNSSSTIGVTLIDVYNDFRSWFSDSFSGIKMPSRNELKEDLLKRWGPMRGNKWKYYRIKTSRDDEEEGNIIIMDDNDFTDGEKTDEEN